MLRRHFSSFSIPLISNKIKLPCLSLHQKIISAPTAICRSTSTNTILDLSDQDIDVLFQKALLKQQQQQQQQTLETSFSSSLDKTGTSSEISMQERKAKTDAYLSIIVDTGVVASNSDASSNLSTLSSSSSQNSAAEALQTVKDMITAGVKFQTLRSNHIRRLFALCGARQREDASREMWIRMLTVIATIKDAERDLFFTQNSLYQDDKTENDGEFANDKFSAEQNLNSKVIVTNDAWNALLGLSVDYVVNQRLRRNNDSGDTSNDKNNNHRKNIMLPTILKPQRAVLQSELEMLLGSKQSEDPHWWILAKMDADNIPVVNKNVLNFLSSEVAIVNSASPTIADKEEALAKKKNNMLRSDEPKSILESRVEMVRRQLERRD